MSAPDALLWSALTLLVYLGALALYQRSGRNPLLLPVATGVTAVILLLKLTGAYQGLLIDFSVLLSQLWIGIGISR